MGRATRPGCWRQRWDRLLKMTLSFPNKWRQAVVLWREVSLPYWAADNSRAPLATQTRKEEITLIIYIGSHLKSFSKSNYPHGNTAVFVLALPYRAADGGASPSPWGDDTCAAPETSSGSSRSHFYSLYCRLRFGDGRLRLAACWWSFPSSFSTDRDWESPDLKFPNLCNVNREVMDELRKENGLNAH